MEYIAQQRMACMDSRVLSCMTCSNKFSADAYRPWPNVSSAKLSSWKRVVTERTSGSVPPASGPVKVPIAHN